MPLGTPSGAERSLTMQNTWTNLQTRCAHAGLPAADAGRGENRPAVPAIVQSTIFDLGSSDDAEALFSGQRPGHAYTRFGNPTVATLASEIAALEGGRGAMITSSGNAAVLCAVTAALDGRTGPLVTHPDVYGGTSELLGILARIHRVPVEVVDAADADAWRAAVAPVRSCSRRRRIRSCA